MEPNGSLPHYQESSTGPYPDPDQSSPYYFIQLSKIHPSIHRRALIITLQLEIPNNNLGNLRKGSVTISNIT
jgi:hypothetical protein